MEQDQSIAAPRLSWRAGDVPVSERFGDPYYSLEDGLAETRHVFLAGNGLPDRLRTDFRVAELGVGTGLNLLALAAMAGEAGVTIRYTGFEAYPLPVADLARALAPFSALAPFAEALRGAWRPEGFAARIGPVAAEIIAGDARATLPRWGGTADAWFLDGFAPARNPELWEPALMREVARHTAPGGTFATYTAAGAVRRALEAAGFAVERLPGHGRKRHMSRGALAVPGEAR
jgi:tRNA U34 5-methylaminomethyl-2-thiouridine-forming methyltransferase MnmC